MAELKVSIKIDNFDELQDAIKLAEQKLSELKEAIKKVDEITLKPKLV